MTWKGAVSYAGKTHTQMLREGTATGLQTLCSEGLRALLETE